LGEAVKVAGVAAKAAGTEAWKTTRLPRKLISVERPSSCHGRRNHGRHVERENLRFNGALKRPVQDAMGMADRSGG
jgi:hypothetical protein